MFIDKISGHTLTDYHEAVKAAPKKLQDVVQNANTAIQAINKKNEQAHKNFKDGYWTQKSLNETIEQCRAEARATEEAASESIKAILEEVHTAEAWSLTVNPEALDVSATQFLQVVTLSKEEYINLANKYAKENYTSYRLVLSQAEAHGARLTDAVNIHRKQLNTALDTFAQYCMNNVLKFGENETPYTQSWGAVVVKFAEPLINCDKSEIVVDSVIE